MRPLVPSQALLQSRAFSPQRGQRSTGVAGAARAQAPTFVLDRLADYALLHGLPFEYLVPHSALLPSESLRFFAIDEAWMTAFRRGVLSVGDRSTRDELAAGAHDTADLLDVRRRRRGQAPAAAKVEHDAAPGTLVTGFLLRSALLAEYPGMQIRAYDREAAALPLLRLDRPAQGVLLGLFAGALASLVLEEPHHGLRLGVDSAYQGSKLQLRRGNGTLAGGAEVEVPMRSNGAPGVLDVSELARRIAQSQVAGVPDTRGGGALAIQLLQPPVRQRFERQDP
jgi:hypothetical protein